MQTEDPSRPAGETRSGGSELMTRIVSGLALAAISAALLWAGTLPFAALVVIVAALMSWEWSHMIRGETLGPRSIDATLVVHALATVGATLLAGFGFIAMAIAVLLIGAVIVLTNQVGSRPMMSALGVFYCGLPAVALLWLRASEPKGFEAVLFIIMAVAITDTAAFAAGRTFGGPQLAPRISPKKTWSGLIGGVSASTLVGTLFATVAGCPLPHLAMMGAAVALVSQAGDLAESALKRSLGVKDASNLLPGHGGFMDRVDGIVTAALAAALYGLVQNPASPATVLLSGL